ncbi:hypothetical protein [Litoribacter populi]|uniref:hypothetical protein n=1 Tax=Litoribacter populi TaxID=2598460 RepID=UPI00117E1A51|nr:hypothetical protein [Litoribacter populi]
MKTPIKYPALILLLLGALFVIGCNDDDDSPRQEAKIYTLTAVSDPAISGNVIFRKEGPNSTRIMIELNGTQDGNIHPAHIHSNSVSQGGPIVIDLAPVDGNTGRSKTLVTAFDDGNSVTYEQLINYNGHANVHLSMEVLDTLIAQGNIGSNAPSAPSPPNGGGY